MPPSGPLVHRCASRGCQATGGSLSRCTGCRVVRYCTHEHQLADWPEHKQVCKSFKDPRAVLAEVEATVPKNARDVESKRQYYRARFILSTRLQLFGTLDSATEAVEQMVEILRLEVDDSYKYYELIVPVLLRLDRDQEAYDVLKYSITSRGDGEKRDRGKTANATEPVLGLEAITVRGASVMQSPHLILCPETTTYTQFTMLALVKLKLLVDLCKIKKLRATHALANPSLLVTPEMERDVVRSPLSASLFVGVANSDLEKLEKTLIRHAGIIGDTVLDHEAELRDRKYGRPAYDATGIWSMLVDPDEPLRCTETRALPCSYEEKAAALQCVFSAYWSTEGVLELLQRTVDIAKVKADWVVEKMYTNAVKEGKSSVDKLEAGRKISFAHETNCLTWPNFKWVVADLCYPGSNSSQRPSRVHLDGLLQESPLTRLQMIDVEETDYAMENYDADDPYDAWLSGGMKTTSMPAE